MGSMLRARVALLCGLLSLGLEGCRSEAEEDFAGLSVEKIRERVLEDMRDASSLTVRGGDRTRDLAVQVESSFDKDGHCKGSIAIGKGKGHFLRTDDTSFMRGDEEYWRATEGEYAEDVIALVGPKWVLVPVSMDRLAELCDVEHFLQDVEDVDEDLATKGETSELDGREALEIKVKEHGVTRHIWVAVEGEHHVLKIQYDNDLAAGLKFSNYEVPVDVEAPAEGEYVDFSEAV
jgi:hypothetical protein